MGLYTHEIKSNVELHGWIHDYAVSFTTDKSNVEIATLLNDMIVRTNMPFKIFELKYTTKAFINDEDWYAFEFSCMLHGYEVTRL